MVVLKEIEKSFLAGRVRALRGLSLEVPSGTFLTVLGPSGCGKTTLLRIVAGLESPDRGRVFIQGRDVTAVPPGRREVAMVFQNYALYPHKRVFDNIALGLRLRGLEREEIRSRIEQVARMLGIEALMERFPRQLSGGQQQRVALARALVRQPQVFLLDEPLSNLDAQVRETTRTELKRLFKALGATVIYVTHDQGEALMMSDLVAVLQDGELRQVASPMEVYHRPEHRFVAEFIGTPRINMIQGSIQDGIFSSLEGSVRFSAPVHYAGAVLLGLRPEHLSPAEGPVSLRAQVLITEPLGANTVLTLKVGGLELKALLPGEPPEERELQMSFDPAKALFFEPRTGRRID